MVDWVGRLPLVAPLLVVSFPVVVADQLRAVLPAVAVAIDLKLVVDRARPWLTRAPKLV